MNKLLISAIFLLFFKTAFSQKVVDKNTLENGFYTSISLIVTNPNAVKFEPNGTKFFRNGLKGDNQGTDFQFVIGYQFNKNSFEIGMGSLTNSLGGIYDYSGEWTDAAKQIGFLSQTQFFIIPARYYYQILNVSKINLRLGGGIINAFVPENDLPGVLNFGAEKRLKSYAITGELSAKLGYEFSNEWSGYLVGHYCVGNSPVRQLDVNLTNPITIINTNGDALCYGLNLQYKF